MRKPLANELAIDFDGGLTEQVTPHAGVALLIETARRSGVIAAAERALPANPSPNGLRHGELVAALVLLSALGGDCLDDLDGLRQDQGVAALTGYHLPAASTARGGLDRFHDSATLAGRPLQGSFIPAEPQGLAALRTVVEQTVRADVTAAAAERTVTFDVDAHSVESSKQEARTTYTGERGSQPLLVTWAETRGPPLDQSRGRTRVVAADEVRDGQVPASVRIKELVDVAAAALPERPDGWAIRVRSDSAAYEPALLERTPRAHSSTESGPCRDRVGTESGPSRDHWAARGWTFAVSADLSTQLRAAARVRPRLWSRGGPRALDEAAWQPWAEEGDGVVREWAEVASVPSRARERADLTPFRYVAIRVRQTQGRLFGDGTPVKHVAVVTTDWQREGRAPRVRPREWQRGKAGMTLHVNRVVKDELAGAACSAAAIRVASLGRMRQGDVPGHPAGGCGCRC